MYSKSLTQGDCSRMSAGSGNRTSVPVQALDHKSNSLPLGHCAWRQFYSFALRYVISIYKKFKWNKSIMFAYLCICRSVLSSWYRYLQLLAWHPCQRNSIWTLSLFQWYIRYNLQLSKIIQLLNIISNAFIVIEMCKHVQRNAYIRS